MSQRQNDDSLVVADRRLLESGNFADATIVCGDRTWKVHKVILASRCKWFKAAFYGNMAEAESGKVVLQEQDPDFIDYMLRFIYAKSFTEISEFKDGKDVPTICVELFRLADFFLLPDLADDAKTVLENHLEERRYVEDNDKLDVPQTLAEVLDSVRRAYKDNSTAPLRQMLLTFLCMRKDRYLETPGTVALIDEVPESGKDLMKTCMSVDLKTSKPNGEELPRELPVLEAVRIGREAYVAGGRMPQHNLGSAQYFNVPCSLRPEKCRNCGFTALFTVVESETGKELLHMKCLAPLPSNVIKIWSHEDSSIVQLFHKNHSGKHENYVRFVCPADAKHYVRRYRNAKPLIREFKKAAATLEKELRTAHDKVADPFGIGLF